MKKKVLVLVLCCALVIGLVPVAFTTAFSNGSDFDVYSNGTPVNSVTLPKNEDVRLTAIAESGNYQWQIHVSGDLWANIVGATGVELDVRYAMVANMLSGNTAELRCRLSNGVDNVSYSNTVTVTVEDASQTVGAKSSPALGTVISGAQAIGDPVITGTPVQATQDAPTVASTPVGDESPVNDVVPADGADAEPADDPLPEGELGNEPVVGAEMPSADEPVAEADNAGNDVPVEPTTYSIVINYVFENGTTAATSWTATVATGTTYQQTIKSPVVLGYTPDQQTVEVNASSEMTYIVTYHPAEVNYTVKHWQQNVDNDGYSLVDSETKKGFTEGTVGAALNKSYNGFYSLLYDTTTTIAADGSTEVNVYYDRYYYLMTFDLDGGYGVEPIYARFGAPISVGEPTKAGYTFTGWNAEIPTTMPVGGGFFTAKWQAGDGAKVTIVVWGENADDEDYSFYHNAEIIAKPGEKLTLDDLQGKIICGKEEHTHSQNCGLTCTHQHDLSCYGLSENARPVTPDSEALKYFADLSGGIQDGYVYYFDDNGYNGNGDIYFLRLNGSWYQYSGRPGANIGTQVGSQVSCDEGRGHKTDYFYKFELKIVCTHTHDDSCYACGKTEHQHTSACYYNTSFMENPALWKLVRSDEITVAADGTSVINVYYDRVEFTLHFRKKNSNRDDYGTIKEKWGADIREKFNAKSTTAGTSSWSENKGASSPWTSYLDVMPEKDMTFYAYVTTGKSTAYYYVEGLDGKDQLYYTSVASGTRLTITEEEFIRIDGFTFNADRSAKIGDDFNNAKFYYTRNSYTLKFFNRTGELTDKTQSVKFEEPLQSYYFEPQYPSDLEPNAYVFDGWYTTAGCYEGSEADLESMTMPASDVILYAKWVPKTHTVRTYLDKDAMDTGSDALQTWIAVPHGTAIADKPADPDNGQYTFVGWFYISETGEEKAFDFSMPVNRDLDLYAKWSSNTLVSYTIRYQLQDGTEIAAPTSGSALAGTTKTFEAKTGTALYTDYQSGYFPMTSSHSMTMDIEGGNTFTFIYVAKESVNYTVRYLEKDTNAVLHEEKHASTRDAVITEKFEQITGYAPDAYQKRLVLSADEDQNIITFWYVKDDVHAPVQKIHWIQNVAGDGYTELQASTDLNGMIGQTYTEDPKDIQGFQYNEDKSNASGVLTADGLVLNLYYDRIEYPYVFRFLEQGTDNVLAQPASGSARYGAQVTQTAKVIPGYKLVEGSAESQAIQIAIEDPADTASKNVKTFYYVEETVDIKYIIVGPANCGTLDNYQDNGIGVLTGMVAGTENSLKGSAPTAANGFRFVGWFKDSACTEPVNENWVAENKLTPQKTRNYGTDEAPAMGYEAASYYAKFEDDVADLTITKQGCQNIDENQSFLFDVTGPNGYAKRVVINGNGSVTIKGLKVGTYAVTEVAGWSWRYTPGTSSQSITLQAAQTNVVNFINSRSMSKWLGGDAYSKNLFGTGSNN